MPDGCNVWSPNLEVRLKPRVVQGVDSLLTSWTVMTVPASYSPYMLYSISRPKAMRLPMACWSFM